MSYIKKISLTFFEILVFSCSILYFVNLYACKIISVPVICSNHEMKWDYLKDKNGNKIWVEGCWIKESLFIQKYFTGTRTIHSLSQNKINPWPRYPRKLYEQLREVPNIAYATRIDETLKSVETYEVFFNSFIMLNTSLLSLDELNNACSILYEDKSFAQPTFHKFGFSIAHWSLFKTELGYSPGILQYTDSEKLLDAGIYQFKTDNNKFASTVVDIYKKFVNQRELVDLLSQKFFDEKYLTFVHFYPGIEYDIYSFASLFKENKFEENSLVLEKIANYYKHEPINKMLFGTWNLDIFPLERESYRVLIWSKNYNL